MRLSTRAKFLVPLLLASLAAACIALPRYPAVEHDALAPAAGETYGLDPWLLADGLSERIVVEIDWVAGCKPGPLTVEGLRETLVELGPKGAAVEILLDDEIPREEWDAQKGRGEADAALVRAHAGLAAAAQDADSREERRYALFVPGQGGLFGYSNQWSVNRGDEIRLVRGVVVNRDLHARYTVLWISLDRTERMTLIHEFGHQLGLVQNRSHEREHANHRKHCTGLGCLMSHPTARVMVRNAIPALFNVFPKGYCKLCRADIRQAQEAWQRERAANPSWRDTLIASRRSEVQSYEIWGLVQEFIGLGRLDEALERIGERDYSQDPEARWALGRALIQAGRHEDAVQLFDREAMRRGEDYDFEQSSFVLNIALVGLGRFEEAADLDEELLSRGHQISFRRPPESAGIQRADLLRRASRNDEALALAEQGLGGKPKSREAWTTESTARILEAAGEAERALAMRRKNLEEALRREAEAKDAASRRRSALTVAAKYAAVGDAEHSREALERANSASKEDEQIWERWSRVQIEATLGDFDRAAELLREPDWPPVFDPCGEESLEPMRVEPRFADVVGHCPLTPRSASRSRSTARRDT